MLILNTLPPRFTAGFFGAGFLVHSGLVLFPLRAFRRLRLRRPYFRGRLRLQPERRRPANRESTRRRLSQFGCKFFGPVGVRKGLKVRSRFEARRH